MAGSIGRPRPKMPTEQLKKPTDYEYDYDRTSYHASYYKQRRDELNAKATGRYRNKVTAKYT